ncbi:MAG TPA: response regulator [Ruminiclostridium sp.]
MKVLVVDDTKNIRTLLTKCLQLEGYDVKTAADGREALDMFYNESFDLAFLDVKMPNFSGTEVLKQIREKGINTPVIIITAYGTVKNAVECTQLGAVAYLQKPFTADKVRTVLAQMMKQDIQSTKDNQITLAEDMINKKHFANAITLLKDALANDPLNSGIYLLLSNASTGLEMKLEADKYMRLYNSFMIS